MIIVVKGTVTSAATTGEKIFKEAVRK